MWNSGLTPDSPPEDPTWSSEVVWSTGRVGVHPLTQESQVLHFSETWVQVLNYIP